MSSDMSTTMVYDMTSMTDMVDMTEMSTGMTQDMQTTDSSNTKITFSNTNTSSLLNLSQFCSDIFCTNNNNNNNNNIEILANVFYELNNDLGDSFSLLWLNFQGLLWSAINATSNSSTISECR